MKVLLSVLPSFQNSSFMVAHLGNACISSYLKKYLPDISVDTFDLRVAQEAKEIWGTAEMPNITSKNLFVSDIYDLPLIAFVINKYQKEKSMRVILEPDSKVVSQWSIERSFDPQKIIEKLRKTNFFAMKYLRGFKGYDLVGFSLYSSNLYLSVFMALLIRLNYPHTKIVFGGPQVTQGETTRELLLKGGVADFLILGEGEQPMFEAINAIRADQTVEQINGVKTLLNLDSIDTFSQNANLEELPVPDYHDTNFASYYPFIIPVYSNRGCPFRCHFCSEHSLFGKKFKRRSPQKVIDDMKILLYKHGINQFTIADSLINSSEEWLEEFTEILLKTSEKFNWGGYFRAELNKDLVKKMKEAGLDSAILGVESFSQQTLNKMNKRKVRQEIIDTIHYLVENEVHAFVNLFVGYPGESNEDFLNTYEISNDLYEKFYKLNKSEYFRITARNFQLRPFSNVYNAYEKFGLEAESWNSYYSEEFYPAEFKNIFAKTLRTFKVNNVSLEDTWYRINLMKKIRDKTLN